VVSFRAALVLGAAFAATPVAAQRAAQPADFLALTRCEGGEAVTLTRPDVARSAMAIEVEAHEAVHRAQASTYPSCEAFVATITSARRTIEVELPAYCAQWRVAVAQGGDSGALRRELAGRVAAPSGAIVKPLEVLEWFTRDCP
jgi:hypothetical protein